MNNSKGVIKIENGILYYINREDIHSLAFFKTKKFQVKLNDLKIIGLYRTISLDDELDMFVFVNKNGEKYYIPINYDLETSSFLILKDRFDLNLKLIQDSDIENYTKRKSIILYPKELEGLSLYKKNNILMSFLKMFRIKPIAYGNFTDTVNSYLQGMN